MGFLWMLLVFVYVKHRTVSALPFWSKARSHTCLDRDLLLICLTARDSALRPLHNVEENVILLISS